MARVHDDEHQKQAAFELVIAVVDDLLTRGDAKRSVAGAAVLRTLRRQRPGFNAADHGFRSFGTLLDEAESRSLLELESDGEPGGYRVRSLSWNTRKHRVLWPAVPTTP